VQRFEIGTLDFVMPAHLPDEQLRIAADTQAPDSMIHRVIERRQQGVVLGDIIRLPPEFLAELEYHLPGRISQEERIGGGAGIPSRCAINVGDMDAGGRRGMRIGKEA